MSSNFLTPEKWALKKDKDMSRGYHEFAPVVHLFFFCLPTSVKKVKNKKMKKK